MSERAATRVVLGLLLAIGLGASAAQTTSRWPRHRQRQVLDDHDQPVSEPSATPPATTSSPCTNGFAAGYPCHDIDLLAFVPRSELGAAGATVNDLWGWTDPMTGREYALVGMSDGTAFVDVTDAAHPRLVGRLPTGTVATPWRDIKVYRDHAFIVADETGLHGMQIFDLRRLRGANAAPQTFAPDLVYYGNGLAFTFGEVLGSAHNVAIDTDTGYAYVLGSDTCAGGLHMVDVSDPETPLFAGCFAGDGYTHDAQCVVYHGTDTPYAGHEICFDSDEDTLTIVDVSDKRAPSILSRSTYQGVGYTHQGWLTEDQRHFLLGDELDELDHGFNTRTYIWDVTDLRNPRVAGVYSGPTTSIDHNLYIKGDLVYEANYRSGLRILDARDIAAGVLREVAYFDIVPADDLPDFSGAWSAYPWFASGNVILSGIEQGLYVLRPHPFLLAP